MVSCSLCLHIFAFNRSLSLGPMSQSRVVDAPGTPVPNSPMQFTSSNVGSPNGSGSGSDLDGMGNRSGSTTDEMLDALLSKFVHFEAQIAQNPAITTWDVPYGFTSHETTGRWLPSPGHQMTVEIRGVDLDTFSNPEDEHARRAVLLRFPSEHHTSVTNLINSVWEKSNMPVYDKPVRIHCKAGSLSEPDLYSKQEPNVRTLWPDIKTMVFPTKLTVHSAKAEPISQSVSPSHLKDQEIGNNLPPCGKFWQ